MCIDKGKGGYIRGEEEVGNLFGNTAAYLYCNCYSRNFFLRRLKVLKDMLFDLVADFRGNDIRDRKS